jgi:catechol 2,3-dioxygenase-like lactoylglutathione lyase family enzyme
MLTISGSFSGFSVDDLDAAHAFYRDKLGLTVKPVEIGLDIDLPDGRLFIYPKENHQPASYTVLNFEVADVDAAVEELVAAGVAIERYEGMPQDEKGIMRAAAGWGPDIAWFTDPAGNILSVTRV